MQALTCENAHITQGPAPGQPPAGMPARKGGRHGGLVEDHARPSRSPVCWALALGAAACGGGDDSGGSATQTSAECAPYKDYQGNDGKTVTSTRRSATPRPTCSSSRGSSSTECTGIKIDYEGTGEFEAQIQVRVDGGNAAGHRVLPAAGPAGAVRQGRQAQAGAGARPRRWPTKNYSADWLKYGTVDGKFYGAPLGSNVKSFVWYSPKMFKEKGYTGPDHLGRADRAQRQDRRPAASSRGAPASSPVTPPAGRPPTGSRTCMLRDAGPGGLRPVGRPTRSRSTTRRSSRRSTGSARSSRTPKYVNGGYGDVKRIATTAFQEGGLPITAGQVRAAPPGVVLRQPVAGGHQGRPRTATSSRSTSRPIDASKGKPVLGARRVRRGLRRPARGRRRSRPTWPPREYANSRAKLGNWVSANKGVDVANVSQPDRQAVGGDPAGPEHGRSASTAPT